MAAAKEEVGTFKRVFTSPVRVLKTFFQRSRDKWKKKCQEAKREKKHWQNEAANLRKSREHWKEKSRTLTDENKNLQSEVARLKEQLEEEAAQKKNGYENLPVESPSFEVVPSRGQYSVGVIGMFVSLVLQAGAALRCTMKVFAVLRNFLPSPTETDPHWTTGRLWLLRLGYYKLHRAKEQAEDWIWMADHSVQIGTEKCLVILGIRLCNLPAEGQCLRHEDMELIELAPVEESNKVVVHEQLEAVVAKTGVPRAIVHDGGGDLKGGVEEFRRHHPETDSIYDIKHKTACLLKARLEKDERWQEFTRRAGQCKSQTQQTELGFLAPPVQRTKARYMNLDTLVAWGRETLRIVETKPPEVLQHVEAERVVEKLGWLRDYKEALAEWSGMWRVADTTERFVREQGLYAGMTDALTVQLGPLAQDAASGELAETLLTFLETESAKAKLGERLPGSTEVLESTFGKLKNMEKDQSKSGFTGLVLGLGALVSQTTQKVIAEAMTFSRTRAVLEWCRAKLGQSVQSKRKEAYHGAASATKPGLKLVGET